MSLYRNIQTGEVRDIAPTLYADWQTAGNEKAAEWQPFTPPPPPPPPVPTVVTPLQMLRALNASGLRASVDAAVAQADQDTRDAWHRASIMERADPVLNAMAQNLGKTSAEIDALFRLAATF